MAKYRSSDRTHTSTKWTKAERAEWEGDVRATAVRAEQAISSGNCRNAAAMVFHIEGIRAHGITTGAGIDVTRAFLSKCLRPEGSLSGARKRRRR